MSLETQRATLAKAAAARQKEIKVRAGTTVSPVPSQHENDSYALAIAAGTIAIPYYFRGRVRKRKI